MDEDNRKELGSNPEKKVSDLVKAILCIVIVIWIILLSLATVVCLAGVFGMISGILWSSGGGFVMPLPFAVQILSTLII